MLYPEIEAMKSVRPSGSSDLAESGKGAQFPELPWLPGCGDKIKP
jgi:hypothetical protein